SGPITLAAAGIMLGTPMAGDKFPEGVVFRPYGYLRNTSDRPLKVDLALSLAMPEGMGMGMGMAAGTKASPPMAASAPVNLAPGETRAIDLDAWAQRLQPGGGAMPGEMLNWSARYEGDSSDLLLTAGSVDGSGSYVFQVVPRQLAASAGEQLPYWSTAEGDNTMYSLWNPGETTQDVVLHLTGADGAGDYEIALHLASGASAMVDLGMIRAEGMPDMHGHLLPASATGSAMLEPGGKPMPGPDGVIVVPKGGLWSMQVIVSTGIFNPVTATCGDPCGSCCGYELPQVSADFPGGDGEIGSTLYAQFEVWDCTGYPMNDSLNASWTASSGLSFVNVDSDDATFTALAVGQQWVSADDYISVVPDSDFVCIRFCEKGDLTNTGYADVVPVITSITPPYGLVGSSKTISVYGSGLTGASVHFDSSGTGGMSATVNSGSDNSMLVTIQSTPGTSSGYAQMYVVAGSEASQTKPFLVQIPTHVVPAASSCCGSTGIGPLISLASGSAYDCNGMARGTGCVVYRNYSYSLTDQNNGPIQDAYAISEVLSDFSDNFGYTPPAGDLGVQPAQSVSAFGYFTDLQSIVSNPSCLPVGSIATLVQTFQVVIGSRTYYPGTVIGIAKGYSDTGTAEVNALISVP